MNVQSLQDPFKEEGNNESALYRYDTDEIFI